MSSKEYAKSYAVKRNKKIYLINVFYCEDKSYVKIKRKELSRHLKVLTHVKTISVLSLLTVGKSYKLDKINDMCISMYGQSSILKLECHLN